VRISSILIARRRAIILILIGLSIALPLIGCVYERRVAAGDARRFPPPGSLIDVGGRRLHLLCLGSGRPTIIVEASGFSNSVGSTVVRTELAKRTRVCSYDRAGVGWSDAGPSVMTIGALADDLRRLQDAASIDPPFVIVASSVGGVVAEMFARRYPERVAGLVILDGATSDTVAQRASQFNPLTVGAACSTARVAGRIGAIRLMDPWNFRTQGTDAGARSAAVMYGAQPWNALCALVRGVRLTLAEFERVPALRPDVPLTVLTAERTDGILPPALAGGFDAGNLGSWRTDAHRRLAGRSTRGSWRVVPGSDHLIASSKPQAVVDAVFAMLEQLR
jgi:pimeloyl-ACP methyl ester carboxylesterase